jgi:aromatic-L-amino-acid/L-tryptophan decarboxylase
MATGALAPASEQSLTLDPEEVRRLGYRAVDAIAERLSSLPAMAVAEPASRERLEARLREPLPERGSDPGLVLEVVLREILGPGLHVDHPRFFAFVPGPGNPIGALADALSSGFSVFAGTWLAAPAAATVELVVVDWLREVCGLPPTTEGLFVSGGSEANLTALAVALEERAGVERPRATVYLSNQAHSSVHRALRVVGVPPKHTRVLASDGEQRLLPAELAAAVASDRAAGRLPACVIATAGTTGTGAVDPLQDLRRLCDEEDLWLHVDGAYGAAARLCPEGRARLAGLELADSLTLDPHKWLFQPLEAGCLLVRDGAALERTFRAGPAYLRDAAPGQGEVNFADRGIQLTRQFRALKLWMSLKIFGAAAFRSAIERGLALARYAEQLLAADPAWQLITPAQLGIVSFRAVTPGASATELNDLNARLPRAALADGLAYVSTTRVGELTALRLCTINPRTTAEDIERTLAVLASLAKELSNDRQP